jgi:hypothetical protein
MKIGPIVRSMSERMPWDVGQRVFSELDLAKGHGWARTVSKYEDLDVSDEQGTKLQEALTQHLICGEKLSRFYTLSSKEMEALRSAALKLQPGEDTLSSAYPLVVPEDQIAQEYPHPHRLVSVETREDGIALVFAGSRAVVLRQELDASELPELVAAALADYDEITVVKLRKHEIFDVVWLPHDANVVDVRIDFPKGMNLEVGAFAHEKTRQALATLISQDMLVTPMNLFGLIDGIYKSEDEGVVVEMAFGTTTASLKHEKMRRAGSCLRKEKYHIGGKAALASEIEPYRLSVQWPSPDGKGARPELSLNSSARVKGGTQPTLLDAVIRKCAGIAEYELVSSRIKHALEAAQTKAEQRTQAA